MPKWKVLTLTRRYSPDTSHGANNMIKWNNVEKMKTS